MWKQRIAMMLVCVTAACGEVQTAEGPDAGELPETLGDAGMSCLDCCTEGAAEACGSDTGVCSAGVRVCEDGRWGACVGAVGPDTDDQTLLIVKRARTRAKSG